MADCGASGTALDQTARALLGSASAGSQVAGKQAAASLMGQAVRANRMMPLVAPDHIVMPHMTATAATTNIPTAKIPGETFQPPALQQLQPHHFHPQQHQHQHAVLMNQQQQQQQHHAMIASNQHLQNQQAMHMQHQQNQMMMMMMQQQNQIMRMRQLQLDQQAQQQQAATMTATSASETLQEKPLVEGHEGLAKGATIEDLAAAWAQAEAEYEELEAAVNLASAVDYENSTLDQQNIEGMMEASVPTYEFINKDAIPVQKQDWMEQGNRHFQRGDMKQAIRAFEMELQQNNPDNASAWRMLGRCHAENDQDREAIICFEHAVDRDPYSPEACLALGVSYVNELNHSKALQSLKAWITQNPKFAGLDLGPENDLYGKAAGEITGTSNTESAFEEVQRLLLRALEVDPSSPDVLEALGVVYNVSRDFDAAIDAFKKAIAVNPNDYQLYNRLGATLANCNRSEEALPAYHKALAIKPKYARAWLNMAISHSNLQNYSEAARCYLQTLSLNPAATHCWSYLRIALSCNEKWDLIPHTTAMDLQAFSEHFDFVMYES